MEHTFGLKRDDTIFCASDFGCTLPLPLRQRSVMLTAFARRGRRPLFLRLLASTCRLCLGYL